MDEGTISNSRRDYPALVSLSAKGPEPSKGRGVQRLVKYTLFQLLLRSSYILRGRWTPWEWFFSGVKQSQMSCLDKPKHVLRCGVECIYPQEQVPSQGQALQPSQAFLEPQLLIQEWPFFANKKRLWRNSPNSMLIFGGTHFGQQCLLWRFIHHLPNYAKLSRII